MRLLSLGLSSLRRNTRRTLLTASSLAVSLFLFVGMLSVIASLDEMLDAIDDNAVVAVMHRGGFTHDMPESHVGRLLAVDGVMEVIPGTYYGGMFGDVVKPQDTFPTMALPTKDESRTIFGDDIKITEADWRAWMEDRTAALIGPALVRRFGWKRGDTITLKGSLRPVDLEFKIVGTAEFFTDKSNFILHREYLEEAMENPGVVSMFFVKARSVTEMPRVIKRINEALGDHTDPVKAMTQKQLIQQFLGLLGDVRGVVGGIGVLVLIAVFFVTMNAMALSARERVPEIAVLKSLGFTKADILTSLLFEGLLVGIVGGVVGAASAYAIFGAYPLELGFGPLSGFQASPEIVFLGMGVAAITGVLAALPSGVRAARLPILDGLRRRD